MNPDIIIKDNGIDPYGNRLILVVPQTPESIATFERLFTCGMVSKQPQHYGFYFSAWRDNINSGRWEGFSVAMDRIPK